MTTEKKKLDRVLHLNLEMTDEFLCVTSIDNETGETYCMDFQRGTNADGVPYHKPEDIMMRVGMEVWSWIEILRDNFDSMDEDGE
jgi:hypothetical protein